MAEEQQQKEQGTKWFQNIKISDTMKKFIMILMILGIIVAMDKLGMDVPEWLYEVGSTIGAGIGDVYKVIFGL